MTPESIFNSGNFANDYESVYNKLLEYEELFEDLNDKKMNKRIMSLDEYLEEMKKTTAKNLQRVRELLDAGSEKEAADIISLRFGNSALFGNITSKEVLNTFYSSFTDPYILFNLIIEVYINDGYHFPKQVIMQAKRIAKIISQEERLKDLPDGDVITVYRGCSVVNADAWKSLRTSISWSTSKAKATWFADRLIGDDAAVWEATIPRDKIIAYSNERGEHEVIQHMNVKNPHLIKLLRKNENSVRHYHEQQT